MPNVPSGLNLSSLDSYVNYRAYQPTDALFNESYYLARNPDVAAAVTAGSFRSGFEHFLAFGWREGRAFSADFDAAYYLQQNPDVAVAIASGAFHSAIEHYLCWGYREHRPTRA